ncbi:MAG: hypothetical protein JW810_02485 [Sedimentisphaerales bacterium]|nr:hypothetical protein [Sedimentisphaerales bacterium]
MNKHFMSMSGMIVLLGLAAAPGRAAPLDTRQVAAAANWVIHLDCDQFGQSRFGQLIRQEMTAQGLDEKLAEFQQVFSFHPIDDIRAVTIYGQGDDKTKGVIIIQGRFDKQTLLTLVCGMASYQEIRLGDLIVHSWIGDKPDGSANPDRSYASFFGADRIVLAGSAEAVRDGIAVLASSAANASDGDSFTLPALKGPGAIVVAAAKDVGRLVRNRQALVLKQIDQIALVFGEANERLFIDADLKATNPQTAQHVGQMLQGILAVGMLAGQNQPELAELAQAVTVSWQDNLVQVSFERETQRIFDVLKKVCQANKH